MSSTLLRPTSGLPSEFGRRGLLLSAAGLAAGFALTACGSKPSAAGSTTTSGTGSSSGAPGKVTLGLLGYIGIHIDKMVMVETDIMKRRGVDLDVVLVTSQSNLVPGIISNSINVGPVTAEGLFAVQDKGSDLKMLASSVVVNPHQLIVKETINSAADLIGKTIGVSSPGIGIDWISTQLMVGAEGVDPKKLTFVNSGNNAGGVAGMIAGRYDAVAVFPPESDKLQAAGFKKLLTASDFPQFRNVLVDGLTASQKWYEQNPDLAVNFMAGVIECMQYMHNPANETDMVRIIGKYLKVDAAESKKTYDYFIGQGMFSPDGSITLDSIKKQIANSSKAGITGLPATTDASLQPRLNTTLWEKGHALLGG